MYSPQLPLSPPPPPPPPTPLFTPQPPSTALPNNEEDVRNGVALSCYVLGNANAAKSSHLSSLTRGCYQSSSWCASSTTCESPSPSDYQTSSALTPVPPTSCCEEVSCTNKFFASASTSSDPLDLCLDAYEHSPLSLPSQPVVPPSTTILLKSLSAQKAHFESTLGEKCAALNKQTKRVQSLSSSLSNLTSELRTLSSDNASLSTSLSSVGSDYDCCQSQLASLRLELDSSRDSLWSLSSSHAASLALLRSAFDEDLRRSSAGRASVALERDAALQRVADAESKLVEVEAFLKSGKGRVVKHLEGELARTKLRLALVMAERDERELGNGMMPTRSTGSDFDTNSSWLGSGEAEEAESEEQGLRFFGQQHNKAQAGTKREPLRTVDYNARAAALDR